MFYRKPSFGENKLLLIFAISQLEPCTNLQLWQFMAENNLMDYLSFQLFLGELVEDQLLLVTPHPIGSLYELTPKSQEHLVLFEKKLPYSRKEAVLSAAPAWKARFQKEQFYLSDYSKNHLGGYTLVLSLFEEKEMLFQTVLGLADQQSCSHYASAWPKASSDIYSFFMALMGEDFSLKTLASRPGCPQPDDVRLTPLQKGFVFEGDIKKGSPAFVHVNAFLPSEEMALYFCQNWPPKKETFELFLHQTLAK